MSIEREQIPKELLENEKIKKITAAILDLEEQEKGLENKFDINTSQGRKGYKTEKAKIQQQILELRKALPKEGKQTFSESAQAVTQGGSEAKLKKVLYYGPAARHEKGEIIVERNLDDRGCKKDIVIESGSTNPEKDELAKKIKAELDKGGAGFEEFSRNDAENLSGTNRHDEEEEKLGRLLKDKE